jgi:hypothetical protein
MRTKYIPPGPKPNADYVPPSDDLPSVDVLPWADPYITQLFARPLAAPRGPRRWPNATAVVRRSH